MDMTGKELHQMKGYLENICNIPMAFFDGSRRILMDIGGIDLINAEKLIRAYFSLHGSFDRHLDKSYLIFPLCPGKNGIFCLAMQPDAEKAERFVMTYHRLLESRRKEEEIRWRINTQALLTNQIANETALDAGPRRISDELNIAPNVTRCAILCIFQSDSATTVGTDFKIYEQKISRCLAEAVLQSPYYSPNDIYGCLSPNYFLIFKEVMQTEGTGQKEYLTGVVEDLVEGLMQTNRLSLTVAVGSGYKSLAELGKSYREANFLLENYDYLNVRHEPCLFIEDYLFEYFTSQIPESEMNYVFGLHQDLLTHKDKYRESVTALTQNSSNLAATAAQLGLHRNTMLQRYNSLRTGLALDPQYSSNDRMVMRSLALFMNRTITWHIGIIIPNHSVLHEGIQHFSELVHKYSNGKLKIILHTLSNSGDNDSLFGYTSNGNLDGMIGSTASLSAATGGKADVLELPFLFDSMAQAEHILNNLVVNELAPNLNESGVICPNIWSMGWRYITSAHTPIHMPSDLEGKKIRIMFTQQLPEFVKACGGTPVKLYYNDVGPSFASGIIDGQENPYTNILGMHFYRYQDYVYELNCFLSTESVMFSRRSYEKLTPFLQECVRLASAETTKWVFRRQEELNNKARDILVTRKRMKITCPTPEEERSWRDIAVPLYANFPQSDFLEKILKEKEEYNAAATEGKSL
ncbi:MAG: TRAP transporter substrate-binding protein DctP [Eubacteriales bacterium]|nr:TRAP transporter substrate-binding protein DctP [Eubacteriales bacterium]